jgi:glycosyltransferase involved in cell wall biosynthesis
MENESKLKILMVSTEYPPMQGGVGRYTFNLVKALRSFNIQVYVCSGNEGEGEYKGLYPYNIDNSNILLKVLEKIDPDIVHIQMEHGLYGLRLNCLLPSKIITSLDHFYSKCNKPIITTFHSSYDFKQWLNLASIPQKKLNIKKIAEYWKRIINYRSFHELNNRIFQKSSTSIVCSKYLANFIPGCKVIYHGANSYFSQPVSKEEARTKLSLPLGSKIALAQGFFTSTKGWDIINQMEIPDDWIIVLNHSNYHYSQQNFDIDLDNSRTRNKIINLDKNFLSECELSLLFYASDVVILPYKVCSGSGVMFDAIGHGRPFIASDLNFFKEFKDMKLGITVERKPDKFVKALEYVDKNYLSYLSNIERFKVKLDWNRIAKQHIEIYNKSINRSSHIPNPINNDLVVIQS